MQNILPYILIDSVITITIIIIVFIVIIKKTLSAAFTRALLQVKANPEKFRDNIEGSETSKKRIIETLKSFDKIKKVKVLKSTSPQFRTLEILVKSLQGEGEDQHYRVNFIIKNNRPKITELARFM